MSDNDSNNYSYEEVDEDYEVEREISEALSRSLAHMYSLSQQ